MYLVVLGLNCSSRDLRSSLQPAESLAGHVGCSSLIRDQTSDLGPPALICGGLTTEPPGKS